MLHIRVGLQVPPHTMNTVVLFQPCFIGQFLPSRLHGKIRLTQRDEWFARVGVLNDEVAGISGERPILDGPPRSGPDADHFGDINETITG